MTDRFPADPPSSFVVEAARSLLHQSPAPRRALDVAMGRGRHALALARLGWRVFGLDVHLDAIRTAMDQAAAEGLVVRAWCGDLAVTPLPSAAFELLVVTRFLQRELFDSIRGAIVPNGVVVYETFTVNQRALGFGPRSPDHLLEPGELRARFDGFDILSYEEVIATEAVARLVARRPGGSQDTAREPRSC
jgi:SAM-dependent methyltransferase